MFWIGRVSCLTLFGSEFLHSNVVVDSCFSSFVVVQKGDDRKCLERTGNLEKWSRRLRAGKG
jgi:hypothetical protein